LISGKTGVLGVIGHPVAHSASPAMHNAALAATGLDYAYVPLHVLPAHAAQVPAAMRALGIVGLNVTVPHKQAIMAGLDEISEEAEQIGAVNTVVNRDGRLSGYNTDAHGVIASLQQDGGLDRLPPRVVVLGAGGAARAILFALVQCPDVEHIDLLNRTVSKAQELALGLDPTARKIHVGGIDTAAARTAEAGLLINSTAVGMEPHAGVSPLADPTCLHDELIVLDIVYKPLETLLLSQARSAGARCLDGLGMLVHQGARSFEIWTGIKPPIDVMRRAVLEQAKAASPTEKP